jgi:ABC-type branched-subunit amino acid transport system substrate-binding protein
MNKTLLIILFFISIKLIAQSKDQIKIALLMPFCAKNINQNPNHKNLDLGTACREYYQGLLIAADSLKNAGINIEITVFDTERDTIKFKKILQNDAVLNADLIIGPVIKEGQIMMQNYKNKKNAYHLSPLFTFTKTKINDAKSISAYPDLNYYAEYLVNYLNKIAETGNLIVVYGKDASDRMLSNYLKQIVKPEMDLNLKQADITKPNDVLLQFDRIKNNYVFLACDDESQVNSILKTIADTNNNFKKITFGLRKIIDFKDLNLEDWEATNLHIITPFYINYNDSLTKKFITTYRNYHETEPNEYAFVGYDQFIMTVSSYIQTKGTFTKLNELKPFDLLANKYLLKEKTALPGIQNSFLHILKYTPQGLKEVSWR